VALVLAGFSASVHAVQSVALAWSASTDPTVAGYNLYYGGDSQTYTNTVAVGDVTSATVSGLLPGATYFFAATAVNNVGLESVFSNEISYQVPASNLPTVALTSPLDGASYTDPATITLAADATANGHSITQVQYYNGATLLGASASAPYSLDWNNVSAGSYSLTAQAVYDAGSTVASSPVNVTVTNRLAPAAISFVQAATGSSDAPVSSLAANALTTTAGHLLVAAVTWGTVSGSTVSISDSGGNAWAIATTRQIDTRNAQALKIFYAPNIAGGSDTVTVVLSPAASWVRLIVHEVAGADLTAPLDQTAMNNTGSGSSISVGPVTTTADGEYIFTTAMNAGDQSTSANFSPGAGYTLRGTAAPGDSELASADQVQSAAGSASAVWTLGGSSDSLAQMATFKAAGTSAPAVALTSPLDGASYTDPATITLAASVTANGHSITQVQYYNGATLLGASASAPYSLDWNNVSAGSYSLTAQAVYDSGSTVASSSVNVTVTPPGLLFTDNFPGSSVAPLVVESGTWTAANNVLSGTCALGAYGYAYMSTNWTDYSVQAQIEFPAGAFGGGIGGRLNAANGAHYGVWVYPEGSEGGSSVMNLVKFTGWESWSGTPMAQASLPGVGTSWHTVLATFLGTSITVSYDGVQEISVTDNDFGSAAPYANGGITVEMGTVSTPFAMSVSNLVVMGLTDTNPAPAVALTSPLDGASYTDPATITLAAGVTANGHSITQVQYYNGATLLGASASAPYSLSWSNVSAGNYSLTAQAVYDAGSTVASSPVNVTVIPSPVLFSDNFPDSSVAPLVVESGTWTVANNVLSETGTAGTFGYAYVSTNWTDYSVQAQIEFAAGALGGGIGGRLNAANGAHYGVWVYPEGSAGGSSVMNLVKFTGWESWSGTPMAQASLPGVGTSWHTVLAAFLGTSITVSYDGVQEISVTDNDFGSAAPYANGGITVEMGIDSTPFAMSVSNLVVMGLTATNPAPAVALTSPLDGASYTDPATITLAAGVTANGHSITQVQYYNGATLLGASASAPYSLSWSNVSAGNYSLTAQAVYDAGSTVASSPVNVTVIPSPVLFSDNFPDSSVAPLVVESGTWTVANNVLSETGTAGTFGYAYVSTNWTDYSVQAQIEFAAGALGGGIGGRLNAANGAHYGVWVYPEGSAGGSSVMNLVKFTGWESWSGTPMAQASLPGVGTSWHTVLAAFLGTSITVSYDGVQEISVTDNDFGSAAPYANGGITVEMGIDSTPFAMSVSNLVVMGLTDTNPAPAVALTSPLDGASYTDPTSITLAAGVTANGHSITQVQYYNGATLLGASASAPYSLNWSNVSAGSYSLTAQAVYDAGSTVASGPVNITVAELPAPWQTTDIGSVGVAGSASISNGVYTVSGAGTVSGTADNFRFVYQPLIGDGEITVCLNSVQNTGTGGCIGVMLRESLTSGSEYAFMGISPDGTFLWQCRSKTGGSASSTTSTIGTPPSVWTRLVRNGNVLYGYQSADGANWTEVNSYTITMATQIYVGLAVASGSSTTLNTATFTEVAVVP
jgi:ACR3 family arsenite efflux pump ArsB